MWILMLAGLLTCGITAVIGIVYGYMLLYKFWKVIPNQKVATPREAVGFCFIGFFNFYWMFIAYRKLAEFYQQYTPDPIVSYATTMCICNIAGWIPYIGGIAHIVKIVCFFMLFYKLKNIVVELGNRSLNNGSTNYGAPGAPGYTGY